LKISFPEHRWIGDRGRHRF